VWKLQIGHGYTVKKATAVKRSRARQPAIRSRQGGAGNNALQIRNVLVPTDFSKPSLEAVEFAWPLIKRFGAELHLVHVFALDYPLASMTTIPLIVPALEIGGRVQRQLKDVARKYSMKLGPENIHAVRGRPFEEICRLARELRIDLIVTSTRGNTGLKHLALGSTAERVVRYSPCPVLVLHPFARQNKSGGNGKIRKRKLNFGKILVPIDFSGCSMMGLAYAKALAKHFGSKLVLLHSIALQYYIAMDEYARYDFALVMERAEKASRAQLRNFIEKTDWDGIKIESSLQIGHAGQQICARVIDHGADVIVTSTHGRTGFKHVLLGSTAEYVVRHASCPVLVVPSHERPILTSGKDS
jgi:nucleotide-binding universal stress UspA family protein